MTYIIYNSDHTIKTFMDYIADVPLAPGETFALTGQAFEEYAARFVLSCKGTSCNTVYAHVGDPALEIDVSAPGQETVAVNVNGEPQTVPLTDGQGSFTLATDTPCTYLIGPADRQTFCAAGSGALLVVILSGENP